MKVTIDSWAWIPKSELTSKAIQTTKAALTIYPKSTYAEADEPLGPIELYTETETHLGVAREWFLQKKRPEHEIEYRVTEGDKSDWPGDLVFNPERTLRPEQERAVSTIVTALKDGKLGGVLKAPCAFGKTVTMCAIAARLQSPLLVVVHKEFLLNQWMERLQEYLPGVQIGIAQQKRCDFRGKHVVVGMMQSLVRGNYSEEFYKWPYLVCWDEGHRVGASGFSKTPPLFSSRRILISATPRRRDGAENVFHYHAGPLLFEAKERRLVPTIKRVFTTFKVIHTAGFNPNLAPESLILKFLCANEQRNRRIVGLMLEAVDAGRKLLILSKRINHLNRLEAMFHREWVESGRGPAVTSGYYIGGLTEDARDKSAASRVIFATAQMCSEGLDIPDLDTLFLVTPMGDVEQAVGRILREYQGKRDPMVVDVRDDLVPRFAAYGRYREKLYEKLGASL